MSQVLEFCIPESPETARAALERVAATLGFRVDLNDAGQGRIRRGAEWRAVVFGALAEFVQLDVSILPAFGSTVIQLRRSCDGWVGATGSFRQRQAIHRLVDLLTAAYSSPCLQVNAA